MHLPPEILELIFRRTRKYIVLVAMVCRQWRAVAQMHLPRELAKSIQLITGTATGTMNFGLLCWLMRQGACTDSRDYYELTCSKYASHANAARVTHLLAKEEEHKDIVLKRAIRTGDVARITILARKGMFARIDHVDEHINLTIHLGCRDAIVAILEEHRSKDLAGEIFWTALHIGQTEILEAISMRSDIPPLHEGVCESVDEEVFTWFFNRSRSSRITLLDAVKHSNITLLNWLKRNDRLDYGPRDIILAYRLAAVLQDISCLDWLYAHMNRPDLIELCIILHRAGKKVEAWLSGLPA